jgi:hypothetical protein
LLFHDEKFLINDTQLIVAVLIFGEGEGQFVYPQTEFTRSGSGNT